VSHRVAKCVSVNSAAIKPIAGDSRQAFAQVTMVWDEVRSSRLGADALNGGHGQGASGVGFGSSPGAGPHAVGNPHHDDFLRTGNGEANEMGVSAQPRSKPLLTSVPRN